MAPPATYLPGEIMTNIEALTILHNIAEQVSLSGKDRDTARNCYGQLAEFIQKKEIPPKPVKAVK